MNETRLFPIVLAAGAAILLGATAVRAEQSGTSDVFKGFGSNKSDPIQIDADGLEVLDKDQNAVFSGNVQVRQKETTMRTQRLRVLYEGKAASGLGSTVASASPDQSQQIRRLEAEGKVLINQKDQTVVGDRGWFDMRSQTARIDGHVVLSQGKNVGRGEWMTVDLKTGQYKLGGRVQLFLDATQAPPGTPGAPAKPAGQ